MTGTSNTFTNTFTKAHQLSTEAVSNAAFRFVPSVFQTTAYAPANALNQYTTVTVGAAPGVTLAYDANGNLTGDGTWTFAYDAENRLKSAAKAGTAASYVYDPLGRRQGKSVNAVSTTFLSDGDEEIAEYDGAGALLRRYVPGPATDDPIAMVTPSGTTNTRRYFHTNRQGSTIAMSADNGTIAEGPYTYDAYGNGAPTTGVPFKYTGRRLDAETGLYYYRARYYSPSLGRFLQVDPVGYGDQMNLYAYVDNDPSNKRDPTGRYLESALDVAFIAADIADISQNGFNWENGLALAADVVGLAVPGATGGGAAVHGTAAVLGIAKAGDKAVDAAKVEAKGAAAADGAKSGWARDKPPNNQDRIRTTTRAVRPTMARAAGNGLRIRLDGSKSKPVINTSPPPGQPLRTRRRVSFRSTNDCSPTADRRAVQTITRSSRLVEESVRRSKRASALRTRTSHGLAERR